MTKLLLIALVAGALGAPCFGQNEKNTEANATPAAKEKFYRLDFSVRELEGERIVNNRDYSLILSSPGRHSSIRAGAHVPVSTTGPVSTTRDVYVGVNIDCDRAQEVDNQFQLNVRSDISSMFESDEKGTGIPMVRSNTWQSDVVVPLRRPTLLFSSDDPATKRKMQLVLIVTPLG